MKTASSVSEAVAAIDDQTELLVTDIHMPDGNGVDLAEAAERRFPELHVLLMTGAAPDRVALGARPLLVKPFTPKELVAAAGHALDAHRFQTASA